MSYAIVTDSTADLPNDYLSENNIDVIPLCYTIDNITYGEETKLSEKDFYERMRTGVLPTTSASNPASIEFHLKTHLDMGLDVLYIVFSSALSSSYSTASIVINTLREEYPNRKIYIIDSKCASLGEGLLVYKAIENQKKGMSVEDNYNWLLSIIPHVCHQFTVNDLHHLHRGGRVSKATAVIGTMIKVKPVLHVDDEGRLVSLVNVRGRKKSLNLLVENMKKTIGNYDNDIVFIGHGDCIEDANYVAEKVREAFGISNILINYVSPTIGAHSGPGTVALFFLGTER